MVKTLFEVLDLMDEYNRLGYNCYFEGKGDGEVMARAEYLMIINTNHLKEIEKEI